MIISHARRFVFFPDPLDSAATLARGFAPFADQDILPEDGRGATSPFSHGMSPTEVEWAFDALGLAYGSYLRITVIENPYTRLVRLYDRIARTDPFWLARRRAGLGQREFGAWLRGVRADGNGAGNRTSPRWRRFGAWSAKVWCGSDETQVIRMESIEDDLVEVLARLGIAPGFDLGFGLAPPPDNWKDYYSDTSAALVAQRYGWDLAQYGYGPITDQTLAG